MLDPDYQRKGLLLPTPPQTNNLAGPFHSYPFPSRQAMDVGNYFDNF